MTNTNTINTTCPQCGGKLVYTYALEMGWIEMLQCDECWHVVDIHDETK